MMEIPTKKRVVHEYETYFKHEGDKSYWTSGSYMTLKLAMDDINRRNDLVDWKVVRVTKTYEYNVARKMKRGSNNVSE